MNEKDSGRREDVTSEKEKRLTVALYLDLCLLHLFHEARVSDHTSCVANLAACFVETRDDAHDCPFSNVRQVCYLFKWLCCRRVVSN